MQEDVEYKVLSDVTISGLEKRVNTMLRSVWKLYGNLVVHDLRVGYGFYQTVIKPT